MTTKRQNVNGFEFCEDGGRAALCCDGQPVLEFVHHDVFFAGAFGLKSQCMRVGEQTEISSHNIFSIYRHLVTEVAYEFVNGDGEATLTVTAKNTAGGRCGIERVGAAYRYHVRRDGMSLVWTETLTLTFHEALQIREPTEALGLNIYRIHHQDGRPGVFIQFADPQPVGASGPAVPMTRDWYGQYEPRCGPDSFRLSWRRRYTDIVFQNVDGSYASSELNKTKFMYLTQDNRRSRLCHPQGTLHLLREDGAGLCYTCNAPNHYHHVCEWGMDFHFWCDLEPFANDDVVAAGTVLECAVEVREVTAEETAQVRQDAVPIELTERERRAADLPAYVEPENDFQLSALDNSDARHWRRSSEGCRWERTGGHNGGGRLVVHNQMVEEAMWFMNELGPSSWGNPFLPNVRYRLSAWVKIEDFWPDPSQTQGPQVGATFVHFNGPACTATRQEVDCGWSESLISKYKALPTKLDWTYIELVTPPCPAYVLYATLRLRMQGRGIGSFARVRWEMLVAE